MDQFGCRESASGAPDADPPVGAPVGETTDDGGIDPRWLIAAGVVAVGATGAVMTRRRFLGMGAVAGLAMTVPVLGASRPARATQTRPNIVWFRSEDNGAEFIGAYGNTSARTPNIDRLATEGVRFDRFFTTSPVCAPTKLGWATGMYEAGMGPGANMRAEGRRPDFAAGFATWLASADYWCATSGNVDYNTDLADEHGFQDTSGNWQAGVEAGMPFFALLGTSTTHEISMHNVDPTSTDPFDGALPDYVPDDPVLRNDRAAYFDRVSAMDAEVGELLAQLDELGVLENTIVVYSSDHGGVLPRSKRFCYDSGLHTPLVVRFPPAWQHFAPAPPGSVIDDPVSSVDAPSTVLHLAGVELPDHFQGQPFAGPTCAPRRYAFSNRNRMDEALDFVRTVRDERYRYIRNYMPHLPWGQHIAFMWNQAGYRRWEQLHLEGGLPEVQDRFWGAKPFEELYDLDADPYEVSNLVDEPDHRERLDALRGALEEHMVSINDNGFIPEGSAVEGWEQSRAPGAYPLERLMELGALAARRNHDDLPVLVDALGDDDEIVRYWGALGCSMLGTDSAPASEVLTRHMDDADETRWVRVQCADALIRAEDRAAAVRFLDAVAGDEAEPFPTRLQAVRSLLFLGPAAIDARDGLVAAAASTNEYVSTAATHALEVVDGTYAPVP